MTSFSELAACFLLSVLLIGCNSAYARPAGISPVLDERIDEGGQAWAFPDPYVFLPAAGLSGSNNYYITGTGFRMAVTTDFTPGTTRLIPLEVDFGSEGHFGPSGFWSFRPYHHTDGTWHGYGTIHYGWFRTVVAHFLPQEAGEWTADKPITKWRFDRVLVGDRAAGVDAYDSELVRDEDGTLYLIYDSSYPPEAPDGNVHILAQRMLAPGRIDRSFRPRPLLSPEGLRSEDRNPPGGMQIVEATHIARCGEHYALFYNVGDFDQANYKIGVAWSDSLIPPEGKTYEKAYRDDPDNLWGNPSPGKEVLYLLQTQVPEWPNYCAQSVNGPGIGNLIWLKGKPWLVFHARKAGLTGLGGQGRYLWKVPLKLDISPKRPLAEWLRPLLD